jgi:hypothetical protein
MALEQGLNPGFLDALALAMDDPNTEEPLIAAGLKIVDQQIGNIVRLEKVKVQNILNGYFNGLHGCYFLFTQVCIIVVTNTKQNLDSIRKKGTA